MYTYSPIRRMLIGLAGLILVVETGLSVGHLVFGAHSAQGIGLAAAVSLCACWWIYQCALIFVTGRSDPAFDMPMFDRREPDRPIVVTGRVSGVVGEIRPRLTVLSSAGPQLDPGGSRRRTPWRKIRAS